MNSTTPRSTTARAVSTATGGIRVCRLAVLLALALGSGTALAQAQQAPVDDDADKDRDRGTVTLERIAVTGSSIKRITAETASPLQIITRQQIDNMGAKTLLQVLENLPAAGRIPLQDFRSMFSGVDGASQASLRGLGAQGTLVLLNGRRLSPFGAPSGFQHQFVNIDTIPAAVIERVEVLTDGASAIYGTDALAGVINVITRHSFRGVELDVNTSISERISAYGEHRATAVFGFGDLDTDHYNIYGSINLYKRDPVYPKDDYLKLPAGWYVARPNYITNFRIQDGSQPGEPNPGTLFVFDRNGRRYSMAAPGCNNVFVNGVNTSCLFNSLPYEFAHVPESERTTVFLGGRYLFNNGMEGYAELNGTWIDFFSRTGPPSFGSGGTLTWFARDTGFNLNSFTWPYLSPTHPYNNLTPELAAMMGGVAGLSYRFLDDTSLFRQRNKDKNWRVLAGLRGTWGQWDWDSAVAIAGAHLMQASSGSNLRVSAFNEIFGPVTTDPATGRPVISDDALYTFDGSNPELVKRLWADNVYHSHTRLMTWDGKIEGRIGALPAGEVRSALGFSLVREEFFSPGNPATAAGDVVWQGGSWFKGGRNVASLFGELLVPVTDTLEANIALRADKYPNFSLNLAPKIGIKWQAASGLLLRGTYSESFRAPGLAESGTGGIYAQVVMDDRIRCDETNAIAQLLRQSAVPAEVVRGNQLLNTGCQVVAGGITTPNPDIKPETARIGTVGFVFQPWDNVSISADYFIISKRNEIIRQDLREVYQDAVDRYGPGFVGAPNVFRNPLSDGDIGVTNEVQIMCANPLNAAVCAAAGTLPGYTVGQLSGIIRDYLNRGRVIVDGFDFDAQAHFDLGRFGNLGTGTNVTVMHRETYNDQEGSGWTGNWIGMYGSPRLIATANLDWNFRRFHTGIYLNYSGGHSWNWSPDDTDPRYTRERCTTQPTGLSPGSCERGAPSHTTVNLNLDWDVTQQLKLGLNLQNVFARMPYFDPEGWEGYDHRYNIWGRVWNLSAKYKF